MGKGGGCVPSTSKKAVPFVASPPVSPKGRKTQTTEEEIAEHGPPHETVVDTVVSRPESDGVVSASCSPLPLLHKIKVYIVFYSMYGHIELLAKHMKEGVDSVEGAEGCLFRVPETLSEEILQKMHAPSKDASIPIISPSELPAADAVLFGFPTRYGAMAAQMKAFFDSTGQLWKGQELAGKPAGFFVSTGTQGGGQETTAWTAITQLVHHGMLFVPVGYTFGADMFKLDEIRGGSPYGAGTFAGDGTRLPTQTELQFAKHQGQYIAGIAKRLVKGL